MAIDYIIGALQLVSAAVNILALGSFWITPGLRTTANRFVINLLIVNIVGCIALTPALWLHGGLIPTVHSESNLIYDGDDNSSGPATMHPTLPNIFAMATGSAPAEPVIVELGDWSKDISQGIFDDDSSEILADVQSNNMGNYNSNSNSNSTAAATTAAAANRTWSPTRNIRYSDCTRFWGFDLVAALGKTTTKFTFIA